MYTNILVATDGSKRAKRAAEHAIDLAKQDGATIHALYVMDIGDAAFVAIPDDIAETRGRLEKKGTEFVSVVEELADDAGIDCVTAVKSGIAPERIVEYAEENDIDLIVIGKRGRSDPDKPAFGSITGRVIGLSSVPVHTV
jgi:nucleotide-binding universal stress UspA family protein